MKIGKREFESWTSPIVLGEILKQSDKIILQGSINDLTPGNISEIESSSHVSLEQIYKGHDEVVYRVLKQ